MVFEVRRLQLGFVPYRDTFTHHFLGYLAPFYALGSIVVLTPAVLKVACLCFNFITAILVWLTLRELGDRRAAWLGAFLTVTAGWFWSWHAFGFNIQSYLTPALAAVILLAVRASIGGRRGSLYACAFWCGVLATFDQRAMLFSTLLAVPIAFAPGLRQTRVLGVTTVALAIVPLIGIGYLWQAGALRDFIEQTLVFPLRYRNTGVPFAVGPFLSAWLGSWVGGERIAVPVMLASALAACIVERRLAVRTLWLLTLGCAAGYAALGGRPYPNYFLIFGPVSLLLMSLAPSYAATWSRTAGRALGIALVVLGVFCAVRPALLRSATGSVFLPANETTIDAVAAHVRERTSPNDGLLVWGFAPQIYVLSDRFRTFRDAGLLSVAGANFASTDARAQGRVPNMVREFDRYLKETPPRMIVSYRLTSESCGAKGVVQHNLDYERAAHLRTLRDLIAEAYRVSLVTDGPCEHAEVFIRKDRP